MPEILAEVVQRRHTTDVAQLLPEKKRRVAKALVSRPSRLLRRQALPDARLDFPLDMKSQLLVDLAIHARGSGDVSHTRPPGPPAGHHTFRWGFRIMETAVDSR